MSRKGSYITSIVYMCDDVQVYQEGPSRLTAGKVEAKTQECQGGSSPLIVSKVEDQAWL
jgi:hypothetical protein